MRWPRHSMWLPIKARHQSAVCRISFKGGIQRGDVMLDFERRRCRCQALTMRSKRDTSKKPTEIGEGFAATQSNDHNVGLLKMLKKYGNGWHTRTVRAQRS